jgi:hypothetical protein
METKKATQQKQQKAKKHYTSKGTGRSSMKTSGHSDRFITRNTHVKVGWTQKDRDLFQHQLRTGSFKFLVPDGEK